MNGKLRESLLPLGKWFEEKLRDSGCELCKSTSGHYTTTCKVVVGIEKGAMKMLRDNHNCSKLENFLLMRSSQLKGLCKIRSGF